MVKATTSRRLAYVGIASLASLALAACGGGSSGGGGGGSGTRVTLITKTTNNPYWDAMNKAGQAEADKLGYKLTLAAGKEDGDTATQATAIENAIARGDKAILIAPGGSGVNSAIKKARDAGLYVVALDTVPDPPSTVDGTIATDNFLAGKLIGQWAAKKMNGQKAVIALLDLFSDKVVSVDVDRDQGFLTGMGIDTKDAKKNGDEAKTGSYSGGQYEIVCNSPSKGDSSDGQTAMQNCLTRNPAINLVYTINEPAASGAEKALTQANKKATIVSVDGGCDPGMTLVKSGVIGATSQQYPAKMAELGLQAVQSYLKDKTKITNSEGLDFYNAGVSLVTDSKQAGVESIDSATGLTKCWGPKAS